jgi:hypothetical protein
MCFNVLSGRYPIVAPSLLTRAIAAIEAVATAAMVSWWSILSCDVLLALKKLTMISFIL